ncbi:MAG: DsrE family protein [Deltaproteobacteria bacterium]|nr:DsrE family protein [Deltaproteobacteria bacterium]
MVKKMLLMITISLSLLCYAPIANAANNGQIPFPGVPMLRQNPKLSFGGFLKAHQPIKIVFSVGASGPQLRESLMNAALVIRYLKSKGYRYKIHFVLYGKAVLAADQFNGKYAIWTSLLRALNKHGVTYSVCHNSIEALHLKSSDIYPFMHIIPAGILSVTEYEMRGYSVIVNPNS